MKMQQYFTGYLRLLIITMSLAACSTTSQLSREAVLQQNSDIAKFDKKLISAEQQGVDYLAPKGFQTAKEYLQAAIKEAQAKQNEAAARSASQGSIRLEQAERDAATSRYELEEVLANRRRAIQAGAATQYPKDAARLEDMLRNTTSLIEQNNLSDAKKQRSELIDAYAQLELRALKADAGQSAKEALERARRAGAEKYAAKTFKLAEGENQMTLSVLEADRNDRERASTHARRAIELAEQSIQITELIKDFDRRDFSNEDIVLWYQKQLEAINEPLKAPLAFSQPNRVSVAKMRDSIAALAKSRDDALKQLQASESKMLTTAQQQQALEKKERETQQRFEYVQSLFAENEANVYRQRQNVLLSVHGFYFPSGQSRIETRNFTLLNKIDRAIAKFPDSKLIIAGHTDSIGDEKVNLTLSEDRAANVAKFLIETGGVEATRITVQGFGEAKPVATNENADGRSRNRRVEVLIINK